MQINKVNVLDNKGFVELIRYMGDDNSVCEAARCSTGSQNKNNAGLVDYLMRHKHTSPFEFVEFVFHIKCPIFVMRQLIRHRTASVNEKSLRYSEAVEEFYTPTADELRIQSSKNMQMTEDALNDLEYGELFCDQIYSAGQDTFEKYEQALNKGVCREQARMILPINLYTEFYWKMDAHNLLHFLKLRMDKHAQKEIRVYADAIYDIIKPIIPNICASFEDHILNAVTFSQTEMKVLKQYMEELGFDKKAYEVKLKLARISGGRLQECVDKF